MEDGRFTLKYCAEYVANTQKHFQNNRRPLSRMYLEKHQIEVTTPRFSSLYYKSTSKYMLNQIAERLHVCICDSSVDPKFKIFYRSLPSGGKYWCVHKYGSLYANW